MRSLRINIEDMQTAQKLDILLGLFGDDIEVLTLREGTKSQNKGDAYEKFVGDVLYAKGYQVIQTGKMFLEKDSKIDLIAIKDNEMILIQCKDYDENNPFEVEKQELIDIETQIDNFLKQYTIGSGEMKDIKIRIFVSQNNILSAKSKQYCKKSERMKYVVLNQNNQQDYLNGTLNIF